MRNDTNSVVTVRGNVDPLELGVTLPHEHLFADWTDRYERPDSESVRRRTKEPITLDTLGFVHKNRTNHVDNLKLESYDEAVDEVSRFAAAGGGAIVDVTPKNVGNDPERVRKVARETGVHVVHGTAYYNQRNSTLPDRLDSMGVDEIADEFVSDVRDGIDGTDVRAGIIGEIGLSHRIHELEEKVLRAGARAAARTGAPMTVHPPGGSEYARKDRTYPASRWGLNVLDIAEEEGLSPNRVVIDHLDMSRWYENLDYQKEIADRGGYVEYDLFNGKLTHFKANSGDAYPSDVERVERIVELIEAGYGSQLLLSHDVYLKIHRAAYGGFGYSHILENIVPILESRGVDEEQITELLVRNPRRVLSFNEPT